jgi:hemerythrin
MPVAGNLFRWTDAYRVNIARLDKQNQKLFDLMSQLDEAFRAREAPSRIDHIVDSLVHNAFGHFSTEESLMEKHDFPGLPQHRAEHAAFREAIATFLIERRVRPEVAVDVLFFTQDWLKQHMQNFDKKYVGYLHERGVH